MMPCSIASRFYFNQCGITNPKHGKKDPVGNFLENRLQSFHCSNKDKYLLPGEIEAEVPPYAAEFCTASGSEETFAVADENGVVSLFCDNDDRQKAEEDRLKPIFKLRAHNNAIFDIAWVPQERLIATASGDQTAALWDVTRGEVITVFKGHSCSLKSVNVSKHDTNLMVTGSRDGNALVWDRRSSATPAVRIQDAHVVNDCLTPMRKRRRVASVEAGQLGVDSRQTVSCALFQDKHTVITSGAMNGTLKIWDLRKVHKRTGKAAAKNFPKEEIPYPGASQRRRGYTCLTMDTSSTNLFASCTDDSIYHYNLSTAVGTLASRQPVCKYQGHYNTSFYIRTALSPDNRFLISGSDDSKSYIWRVDGVKQQPVLRLVSDGMSEVTTVAWCPHNFSKVVTCSDECVVRVWKLPYCQQGERLESDVDGYGEVLTQEMKQDTVSSGFTPKFVVRRDSIDVTPPRTNGSLTYTPQKSGPHSSLQRTPLHPLNTPKSANKTPPSIDRWLVRTPGSTKNIKLTEKPMLKRRAVKCLEGQMAGSSLSTVCDEESENEAEKSKENVDGVPLRTTPRKNWLRQLSQSRQKSEEAPKKSSPGRKMKAQPPATAHAFEKTPNKSKTLHCYFNSVA